MESAAAARGGDLLADGRALRAAIGEAVQSARRHEPNIALVSALEQLARHKADELQADARMSAALEEAVGRRQRVMSERGIAARPLQPPTSRAELQRELVDLQDKLVGVNLHDSTDAEWQPVWQQRNIVRTELIVELSTSEARLEARRDQLDGTLSNRPTHAPDLAEYTPVGVSAPGSAEGTTGSGALSTLLAAKAELDARVREMGEQSAAARVAAAEMAAQLAGGSQARHEEMSREREECAEELMDVRRQLRPEMNAHERWTHAQALLELLSKVHSEFKEAKMVERKARRHFEDLVGSSDEELDESEPDVARAKQKSAGSRADMERLLRRREGIQVRILELATAPQHPAAHVDAPGEGGDRQFEDDMLHLEDTALRLDLPELPVRAHRVVLPFKPTTSQASPRDQDRRHTENMLRRDGLLVDRSYENFSEDGLPDAMHAGTLGKMHVKAGRLRGAGQDSLKILKAIPLDDYKRVKRAVVTAHRLKHRGIVPVECAFVDKKKHVVVTQSRYYAGGNMRTWARGKSELSLLVSAQRIAAAITRLHDACTLHRDIKPENVVFDGTAEDAWPALCDFDLSLDMRETNSATVMRGTLLYMAPELKPSPKSDVFSFGVALLDMLVFAGDQDRLPTEGSVLGPKLDIAAARGGLGDDSLHLLIKSMLSEDVSTRPAAADVARLLAEMINTANSRDCPVCMDTFGPEEGLACTALEGCESHFVCHRCMSQDIISRQVGHISIDDLQGDYVYCCSQPSGCESPPFPLQCVARHCSGEAFAAISQRIDELKRARMERDFDQKRKDLEQDLLRKSKEELEVLAARRHIEDEIMVLCCPSCRLAFSDYTGCAALTCHGCQCGFCALCLEDCGADAHQHVAHCRLNPAGSVHVRTEDWNIVVMEQRCLKLQEYWNGLADEVKETLGADGSIQQIFADLGMPLSQGVEAYEAEVVHLREMGFEELQIVAALREAGGDVDQAMDALLA